MHIQVVLAAANPRGTTHLQLDEEVRRIETQLGRSEYAHVLKGSSERPASIVLRSLWAAQLADLVRDVTAFAPEVVQFSGHGQGKPGLLMIGDDGAEKPISGKSLAQVLGEFAATTRLVILNTCHSKVQAEAICQVIDCVIGMKHEIGDSAAALFVSTLYGQLALGSSVGRAFRLAQGVMAAQYPEDAKNPCLQCRTGIDADQVYLTGKLGGKKEPEWKSLLGAAPPQLPALRRAINLAMPQDSELDAFVKDQENDPRYARVRREWGSDMQRQRKLSLLFDYGPPADELKAHLLAYLG